MMFYNAKIDEGLVCFINTLSEGSILANLIEKFDSNDEANLRISKWKSSNGFLYKNIFLDKTISNIAIDQKTRYILNSLKMSFVFSDDTINKENKKNIKDLKIIKINTPGIYRMPEFIRNTQKSTYGLLVISSEANSVSFSYKDFAFALENGSMVFSESDKQYEVKISTDKDTYFAFTEMA